MSDSQTIQLKRQVTVKTMVTDVFRDKAKKELGDELQLIDAQIKQLEAQYNHTLGQLENLAKQGQPVQKQLDQLNKDAQAKRNQLSSLKMEVSTQIANLDKVENGKYVTTGMLENFVDIRVGDSLYEKIRNAEVLIKDGVVTAING